jgi:lantibiotic transport system ATP-binding protein
LQDQSPVQNGESLSVAYQDIRQVADINRRLTRQGLDVYLLHPKKTDLEQLFIDLTTSQS